MSERHVATIRVVGRPATFATAGEAPWKDAVRRGVAESGCRPLNARFAVAIEFRLGPSRTAGEVWDLDNLIKPTLDAMEGVVGLRQWRGRPQPADDRVDRIHAIKRLPVEGESPGATIDVWVLEWLNRGDGDVPPSLASRTTRLHRAVALPFLQVES